MNVLAKAASCSITTAVNTGGLTVAVFESEVKLLTPGTV